MERDATGLIDVVLPKYACVNGKVDTGIEILSYDILTNRGVANFHGALVVFEGKLFKA